MDNEEFKHMFSLNVQRHISGNLQKKKHDS